MTPSTLCIAALPMSNNQVRAGRKCVRHARIGHSQRAVGFRSSNCLAGDDRNNEYFAHNRDAAPPNS